MKKLTLVLMTVVLGVLLTTPAFAFGPGEGNPAVARRMPLPQTGIMEVESF